MNWKDKKVVVTGGAGFLGRHVVNKLKKRGAKDIGIPRRAEFDLTTASGTKEMYKYFCPDIVLHLAAEVGGIGANQKNPGRYFFANMSMSINLIEEARVFNIEKFIQVGTICAYPKFCPIPFKEEDLHNGYPEETNAPYGIAKKAAMVMLDGYQRQYGLDSSYVLPVNLYGPHDNFDLESSHVIPALIRKCVNAVNKNLPFIECWGTGSASREFLYVEDAAEGIICAAEKMNHPIPINLGTASEITIKKLVELIASTVGFKGEIKWDSSKPDGQPRRMLDTSRAKELLGWEAKFSFDEGLKKTVEWWKKEGLKKQNDQ